MLNLAAFLLQFLNFVEQSLDFEVRCGAPVGHQAVMLVLPDLYLGLFLIDQLGHSLILIEELSVVPEDHIDLILEFTYFFAFPLEHIDLLHEGIVLLLEGSDEHFGRVEARAPGGRAGSSPERTGG